LLGAGSYQQLKLSHKGWIEEYLGDGPKIRLDEWTDSIAVGSKTFVEKVKALLGFRAKGRDVKESVGGNQLREGAASYNALFEPKKHDIDPKNTYFLDINYE
jgi:putative transposase